MLQITPARSEIAHVVLPGHVLKREHAISGETVEHFLERSGWHFKIPTICVLNGEPLLRTKWNSTIILPTDHVGFISKPHGGGGNGKLGQILGIVAIIALTAIAPWAAGAIGSALGITSSIGIGLIQAGLVIGGSLLISSFIKPQAGNQNLADSSVGQLYSLSVGGNTAKPLQAINVQYGRLKILPDYASTPYSDYIGNDQYLNVILCQGLGKYDVEQILIDDTILWTKEDGLSDSFTDVDIRFYDPGEEVDLFPSNVTQSVEVSGQTIPNPPGVLGPFVANAAGTSANSIAVDLAFPAGLFEVDDHGNIISRSVTVVADYRKIDNAGSPIGDWTQLFYKTYTFATRTPQRMTEKVDVDPGRYEIRVNRTSAQADSTTVSDSVIWGSLRSFLEGPTSFADVSVIGIRIKASAQLSNSSAQQIGVIQTRILPVWDPLAGGGAGAFVEEPTQSPIWAFWDIATNSVYGAKHSVGKTDFQKVVDAAAAAESRGDTFNYNFTSVVVFPQAFDKALAVARSKHCWVGDVLTIVRDEWKVVPQMLLSDQQITRGSVTVNYILNDENSSDAVIGQFLNEDTWRPAELQYPPNDIGFTAVQPSYIQLDGITDPDHMFREIAFFYKQSQKRRTKLSLDTEHDGRLLKFGDVIKVQSNLPSKWGSAGELVSKSGLLLTLNHPPKWAVSGQHYIEFRDKRGKYFGPIKISKVTDHPEQALLDETDLEEVETDFGTTIDAVLDRMDGAEPPAWVIGLEGQVSRNCIVLGGKPSGDKVTLDLVMDDPSVHDAPGTTPDQPVPPPLADPSIPIVGPLLASFRQGVAEPILDVSWWPVPGAIYYSAEVSYDNGGTWTPVYEGANPQFSSVVDRAGLKVRVSAHNTKHGPWTMATVIAPTIVIAPDTVAPSSMQPGLQDYVMTQLGNMNQTLSNLMDMVAANASEQDSNNWLDKTNLRSEIFAQAGGLKATITTLQTVVANNEQAFANYQITVSAEFDAQSNMITQSLQAIADINGNLATRATLSLNTQGKIVGYNIYNGADLGTFDIEADFFRVGKSGVTGGSFVPVFQVGTVGGVAKLVLRGDIFADGSITAQKLIINELSAITASAGTITAGKIQNVAGTVVFDVTNGRLIGYGT